MEPPFDQPLEMTVFDMREFYAQCDFKAGDSLMLKVEDSLKGVLSVRHLPAQGKSVDFAGTHDWVKALRDGFDAMREQEQSNYDCAEQMAWMFYLAESDQESRSVLTDPALSLPDFFRKQEDLTMKTIGQLTAFMLVDESIEDRMMKFMDEEEPEAETELDAIFQMMNLSLDTDDADAYMRDAIACGNINPSAVLERALSGRELIFPNEIIRQEFIDLWEELWDEVLERYNPKKDRFCKTRSVFLGFNDRCLKILRDMDLKGMDPQGILSNPDFMQLTEITGMIHSVFQMTNQMDEDTGSLPLPLDEISEKLGFVIDDLAERLTGEQPQVRQPVADGPVCQLKITLQDSNPPIWRRVLVPAGMELEDLHDVIQAVFGWDNCHLHQFVDGGTFYQAEDDEVYELPGVKVVNYAGISISDLLHKEKDEIVYKYDFGDSWDHTILLEKVLKPKAKQVLPICTKGARACPPEDCGGMNGYYHLLEVLSGPDCKGKRELLEWAGGPIDPEDFDLVAINARFRMPF
jgi:hypothetical protein